MYPAVPLINSSVINYVVRLAIMQRTESIYALSLLLYVYYVCCFPKCNIYFKETLWLYLNDILAAAVQIITNYHKFYAKLQFRFFFFFKLNFSQ